MPRAGKKDDAVPADPLAVAVGEIRRQYGEGSIMRLGDVSHVAVDAIPTGSLLLDAALGFGGLPRGRITEIYGVEGSGKTTLGLHAIANAQRMPRADGSPGIAVMIDAEHALDPDYALRLGVDTDRLLVSQPDSGEQALEIADMAIRTRVVDVVLIDSVAALVPQAEIDGLMGDVHVGLQARLMSQALRKITGALGDGSRCCVIFINQLREKVSFGWSGGPQETTSGGKALKYYASVRLDVRRLSQVKDGDRAVGQLCKVTVAKNKLAPPFRKAEFTILYGLGISWQDELLDLAVASGVIAQSGAYYNLAGEVVQGRAKARLWLHDHRPEAAALMGKVREILWPSAGITNQSAAQEEPHDDPGHSRPVDRGDAAATADSGSGQGEVLGDGAAGGAQV